MEHLEIIQALIRSALSGPSPALYHQIGRLRDAVAADGDGAAAAALDKLATAPNGDSELRSSRLRRSVASVSSGEELTAKTRAPVDRETSSVLAEVIPVDRLPQEAPIFEPRLAGAIDALLNEWTHADMLAGQLLSPSRSCLLYGAPGTGKTELALWIASQLGLPVVLARLDGLISSFLGTTARNIGALFQFAARYRCLLLLDEFDAIAKLRDDPQEVGEIKRVVNALLQNLDQRASLGQTIAVTNHERLLDPAIWRRFEMQISIPKPGIEERRAILTRYFMPASLAEPDALFLAWLTEEQTGADLESFSKSVKRHIAILNASNQEEQAASIGDIDLVSTARRYFSLNSGRISKDRFHSLTGSIDDLIDALAASRQFSGEAMAKVLRLSPSQISRRKRASRVLVG